MFLVYSILIFVQKNDKFCSSQTGFNEQGIVNSAYILNLPVYLIKPFYKSLINKIFRSVNRIKVNLL
jgi:hypothetical protein